MRHRLALLSTWQLNARELTDLLDIDEQDKRS